MARRIRWQIVIAGLTILFIGGLLGRLALSSAAVANPRSGGSYVEALIGQPQVPVPLLNDPLNDPVGRSLIVLLYDGLVRVGADGLLEPALAERYEIDPTGEVYTFYLRPDVRWHDGAPFSADDVIFTLRTLQDGNGLGDPMLAEFWQDALVDRIDARTVRVTLSAPFAPLLSLARVPMLPAHLLAALPPAQWAESPYASQLIGTGPFSLTSLDEARALLVANPDYFGGRPYIDQMELRFIAAPEAAVAALARGDVQALGERALAELVTVDLPPNIRRAPVPLDEYAVLSFNLRQQPFDDAAFRRALVLGFDKQQLVDRALNGLAAPLDTPILSGSWAFDPTVEPIAPDFATATRTLEELGFAPGVDGTRFRDGVPLRLELITDGNPRRLAAAEEVQRQWAQLGVGVEIVEVNAEELNRRLAAHDFALAIHGWTRIGPDPDPFALWHSSQAERGLNYAGLQDEQIDELIVNARVNSDTAERAADYAAFQQRWTELAPSITLYQPLYIFAADGRLGGLGFEENLGPVQPTLFGPEDRYRSVTRWFLNSSREIRGNLP